MMYGRLKNGALFYAPKMLIIDEREKWFPTEEEYRAHDYKPIAFTDSPTVEDGYASICTWSEDNNGITQEWHIEEADPTPEEIVNILTGGAE